MANDFTDDRFYYIYANSNIDHERYQTTTTISCDICYIIEDGKVRQVSAKELAIEEIKSQPFY